MKVPTRQIDDYSDRNGLKPATGKFLRTIYVKAKAYYQKFIVNLHDLNQELARCRQKGLYSPATLKYVRDQIMELPTIKVKRQHSAYVFELILIPFSDVKKNQKIDEKIKKPEPKEKEPMYDPEPDTGDASPGTGLEQQQPLEQTSEDTGLNQQLLIQTNKLCKEVGINYQVEDLPKIAKYGVDAVKAAIKLFKKRSLTSKIRNPAGWLRSCLERGWYRYVEDSIPVSAIEQFRKLREYLLETLGTLPI
ncbi:MAG: hypothetical protein QNJ18_18220 [Xenococcaceae cyanobacterium MO_167.B52]|nr:hypothetical protein [Xenococcaceae cyanobacterium MO_167.B52]